VSLRLPRPVLPGDGRYEVYLDQAATSYPKPEAVYLAVDECLRKVGGNPGRSGHWRSLEAGRIVLRARELLARLLGARDPAEIILTFNATDALNLALKGSLRPGDHVVTTSMEHNSVVRPLVGMARRGEIELTVVQGDRTGLVPVDKIKEALRRNTAMVVVTHASNVAGTINPIEEIAAVVRERDILMLVDAAQTAGCLPIDVQGMGVDLLAFSGHKGLFGPQGTGGLYVNSRRVKLRPWREGGTGSRSEEDVQPDFLPDWLEAGTPNTPGLAGLAAGVEYVLTRGVAEIRAREVALMRRLREQLADLPGVRLYGPADVRQSVGILSLTVEGWDNGDLAYELERSYRVLCRPGLHCAPYAHRTLGTFPAGTVRFSVSCLTEEEHVDYAAESLRHLVVRA